MIDWERSKWKQIPSGRRVFQIGGSYINFDAKGKFLSAKVKNLFVGKPFGLITESSKYLYSIEPNVLIPLYLRSGLRLVLESNDACEIDRVVLIVGRLAIIDAKTPREGRIEKYVEMLV